MIRLVTVQHTGTRWMERELRRLGVEFVHEHFRPHRRLTTDPSLPTLVLVRDPMLHVISKLNQGDVVEVDQYRRLAALVLAGAARPFRVDVRAGHRRSQELYLAALLKLWDLPSLDWSPEQPTPDRTGLKARYEDGELPDELVGWAEKLSSWPDVLRLLDRCGYRNLRWLEASITEGG